MVRLNDRRKSNPNHVQQSARGRGRGHAQASTIRASAPRNNHHYCIKHNRPKCTICLSPETPLRSESNDLLAIAPPRRRPSHRIRRPIASLSRRIRSSGIRTDSFNSFPYRSDLPVDFAVDHLVSVLAPLLFGSYPKFGNPVVAVAFPYALQHADMFGALVTFSQAHVDSLTRTDGSPSYEMLFHWGKTVKLLQDKMSDPERCADDAAIMTNIYMMGAAVRFKEQAACETFYHGIQRMVAIRGGLDKLGLDGYVKNCILYVDGLGLAHSSDDATDTTSEASAHPSPSATLSTEDTSTTITSSTTQPSPSPTTTSTSISTTQPPPLEYPTHPFSPDLCIKLAKLPPGFVDLALHGFLSVPLIDTIERILHYASSPELILLEHGPGEHLYELKKLMRRVPTSPRSDSKRNTELLVCLAFMILCMETFTAITIGRLNEARWQRLNILCIEDSRATGRSRDPEKKVEGELHAWAMLMAAKAGTEDAGALAFNGMKGSHVLMDRLLGSTSVHDDPEHEENQASVRSPASSKPDTKLNTPTFPFARRWKGPNGLNAVLGRFFINEELDHEWHGCWRQHMSRKGLVIDHRDDTEMQGHEHGSKRRRHSRDVKPGDQPPDHADDDDEDEDELDEDEIKEKLIKEIRERSVLLYGQPGSGAGYGTNVNMGDNVKDHPQAQNSSLQSTNPPNPPNATKDTTTTTTQKMKKQEPSNRGKSLSVGKSTSQSKNQSKLGTVKK